LRSHHKEIAWLREEWLVSKKRYLIHRLRMIAGPWRDREQEEEEEVHSVESLDHPVSKSLE
jgi:hypothetical protein